MDAKRIDNFLEKAVLCLILFALCVGVLGLGAVRAQEFLVLEILASLASALWLVRLWIRPGERVFWPPLTWVVLLFMAYAGVRWAGSPIEYVAREECRRVLLYGMLFLVAINNANSQESSSWVVGVLLALGAAISTYALYQFVTESNRVWTFERPEVYARRGSGTYICPNHLAGFLELILPLGLAYTLIGRLGHKTRILAGYGTLMILLGLAASISRGGWIAAGLSILLFLGLLSRQPSHRLPAIFAVVLLLGIGAYVASRSEAVTRRFEKMLKPGQLEYALQRVHLWKPAVEIWKDHPWIGAGPAHFDHVFRQYRPPDYQVRPVRAHNDYLNTLADWGVVGTVLVASAFGVLFFGVSRTWKFVQRSTDLGSKTSNRFALVLGASCGLSALLFHSVVDFNFHIPANALAAVLLMALLSAHQRYATDSYWVPGRWGVRLAVSLLVAAGSLTMAFSAWHAFQEFRPLEEASRLATLAELRTQELAQAHARDPQDLELNKTLSAEIAQASHARLASLEAALRIEPANAQTAYLLGEAIRLSVWQRTTPAAADRLKAAMELFSRSAQLNPLDPYPPLRHGMCLDYLRRHDEALPYYERAVKLDPNGYYTAAHQGWHFVQKRDWVKSREWFERSLQLKPATMPDANPIAYSYLRIVNRMLESQPQPAPGQ